MRPGTGQRDAYTRSGEIAHSVEPLKRSEQLLRIFHVEPGTVIPDEVYPSAIVVRVPVPLPGLLVVAVSIGTYRYDQAPSLAHAHRTTYRSE